MQIRVCTCDTLKIHDAFPQGGAHLKYVPVVFIIVHVLRAAQTASTDDHFDRTTERNQPKPHQHQRHGDPPAVDRNLHIKHTIQTHVCVVQEAKGYIHACSPVRRKRKGIQAKATEAGKYIQLCTSFATRFRASTSDKFVEYSSFRSRRCCMSWFRPPNLPMRLWVRAQTAR